MLTNIGVGDQLRNYRLAIAATAEYTAFFGSQAAALSAIQTFVDDVNVIFEQELAIHLDLVTGTNTIFTDAATDGYTNGNTSAMIGENTPILDSIIGNAAYDIGHVFGTAASGGAGLATLGVVNDSTLKGRGVSTSANPQGASWVNLVGHEIGHQFDANHTFNAANPGTLSERSASTAWEPGSGSTIMSYAGIAGGDDLQSSPDDYFHSGSFEEIQTFIAGSGTPNSTTSTGNSIPTINAGSDYTIPFGTPFELTAIGSDADSGDTLTYNWEQLDTGPAMSLPLTDNGSSPLFRSFMPDDNANRVFPRLTDLVNNVNTAAIGEVLPDAARSLNFRATVRDGNRGVNSDDVLVTVANTGPFTVTSPNTAINWTGGSSHTITWDVGGTDANGINVSNVAIDLSLDGGLTYPLTLESSTANDGSHTLNAPNIDAAEARVRIRGLGNVFFDISNANFTITSNPAAPGFTITESDGNTSIGEDGVVGGPVSDSYTVEPNTAPSGAVTVTVNADAQTEVSTDNVNFSTSVPLTFTSTTAQTVFVRGLDDTVQEGVHSGNVTHTVTTTADANYPTSTLINPVATTIADDELQPVVGVDFDQTTGTSPTNWTRISQLFGGTTSDLIREDGVATGIGLTLGVSSSAGLNASSPNAVPLHTPDLTNIDGNHLASESLTLTWTGLTPGMDYNIYLLQTENFGNNVVQSVTITGGAGNPLPFTQDTSAIGNSLLVNTGVANPAKTLEADAVVAKADANGEIRIVVEDISVGGTGDAMLAGAAIQQIGPGTVGFGVTETGTSTTVSENLTTDTFDVVLTSQPADNVVINVTSGDTGEATVSPAALTFTTSNWNTPQTVTVTGVNDNDADGGQTTTVTLAINTALTLDDDYDSVGTRTVTVVTEDNESTPLVGVDFDSGGAPPTNWTSITGAFGSTTSNLINEDGDPTAFDLNIAVAGGAAVTSTTNPSNLPDHPNSLANLGGVRFSTTSITLTWQDLTPGTEYDLWVFLTENFTNVFDQTVTVTGGGTNPAPFVISDVNGNVLRVNSATADPANNLQNDAVRATADINGEIQILVAANSGAQAALSGAAIQEVVSVAPATIVGRHLFYNESAYDGDDAAANASDDSAVDTSKSALLGGNTATFANYTGHTAGINGIMIDIMNLPATPVAGDFEFTVGTTSTPSGWTTLATSPAISVRASMGTGGSDRVTLIWPDNTIVDTWLEVTILSNGPNSILPANDTFYFGSKAGEVGLGNTRVDSADYGGISSNFTSLFGSDETVDSAFDVNKSGRTDSADTGFVGANFDGLFEPNFPLISPPASDTLESGTPASSGFTRALTAPNITQPQTAELVTVPVSTVQPNSSLAVSVTDERSTQRGASEHLRSEVVNQPDRKRPLERREFGEKQNPVHATYRTDLSLDIRLLDEIFTSLEILRER